MPITQAASAAKLGWGAGLFRGALLTPTAFVQVAEVTRTGTPTQEREKVEVTHLASPNRKREYIPGMGDLAEMEAECNFRPDNATQDFSSGIIADYDGAVTRYWRVLITQFASEYSLTFTGYVASYGSIDITPDAAMKMPFKIQLSSDGVWA